MLSRKSNWKQSEGRGLEGWCEPAWAPPGTAGLGRMWGPQGWGRGSDSPKTWASVGSSLPW